MSEATVHKIREDEAPAAGLPAVGCNITTNLGGDRQIVLQTYFPMDAPDDVVNPLLDRLLRLGDRQKAKYDLEKLEDEFRTVGVALTNLIDGFPIAERNFAVEQEMRAERLRLLKEGREKVRDDSYGDWQKSGKRGDFELKGHALAAFNRVGAEIEQLDLREKSAVADKAQHRETLLNSVRHYRQDLAKKRIKLNAVRALAGLEPNNDFAEAETAPVEGL